MSESQPRGSMSNTDCCEQLHTTDNWNRFRCREWGAALTNPQTRGTSLGRHGRWGQRSTWCSETSEGRSSRCPTLLPCSLGMLVLRAQLPGCEEAKAPAEVQGDSQHQPPGTWVSLQRVPATSHQVISSRWVKPVDWCQREQEEAVSPCHWALTSNY